MDGEEPPPWTVEDSRALQVLLAKRGTVSAYEEAQLALLERLWLCAAASSRRESELRAEVARLRGAVDEEHESRGAAESRAAGYTSAGTSRSPSGW